MKIQDLLDKVLINQRLVLIDNSSSSFKAAVTMLENKCGALLVCDSKTKDGTLVGIVTERDLAFRVIPKGLDPKKTPVEKIMTKNVDTISPNKTTLDAIKVMKTKGFRHLPVTENKKIMVYYLCVIFMTSQTINFKILLNNIKSSCLVLSYGS